MASLRIKLPDKKGEMTHVLAGQRITIGRRPENTIQIVDGTVSAHHAELIVSNGHYRLHDLGSTNRTCVDGQPISDYHLHRPCKLLFGSVECDFSPEPATVEEEPAEIVPTRAELDFLRHENLQLQSTIAAQQKRIDILGSARLMTRETTDLGATPDTRRRLSGQNDELRAENEHLKNSIANLKADLLAVTRDRDATRQAWETLKAKRKAAGLDQYSLDSDPESAARPTLVANAPIAPPPAADPQRAGKPLISPEAHRAMAAVLMKAPALLESVRTALEKATASPLDETTRIELLARAAALADCMLPIKGHPVERLAASFDVLVREPAAFDAMTARTLKQGAELARLLLAGKHLKNVKELSHPRVLAIDDDNDLVATLVSALASADILTSAIALPSAALALLHDNHFDLILLDIALPEESGIDLCPKIREIPGCKKTPIVFVTARDTIDNRAQSSLGGGNDFITKPFNSLELTLKAQIWIYRYQFALVGPSETTTQSF